MRTAIVTALAAVLASAAFAQEQPDQQAALTPQSPAGGTPVYDIVAADRETAWRINRVTGEVVICRIDTTGGLDSVRARCTPATIQAAGVQGNAQQSQARESQAPAGDGTR